MALVITGTRASRVITLGSPNVVDMSALLDSNDFREILVAADTIQVERHKVMARDPYADCDSAADAEDALRARLVSFGRCPGCGLPLSRTTWSTTSAYAPHCAGFDYLF